MIITFDQPVYTALSGTSEVLLGGSAFTLPEWCRSIISVTPLLAVPGATEGESAVAILKISSDDLVCTPLELLCNCVQPALISVTAGGEASIPGVSVPIKHRVNISCKGGEKLNLFGMGLINHTIEPMMSVSLELSDASAPGPRIRSRVSALETSGVVDVEAAGTPLDFKDIHSIMEIRTMLVGAAVPVVLEGASGGIRLTSSEFVQPSPVRIPLPSISGSIAGATSIVSPVSTQTVARVNIPTMTPCRVSIYSTLQDAMTTATKWIIAIKYL